MSDLHPEDVGRLMGLLVHDLRNPAATFGANIEFLMEAGSDDPDAREALEDLGLALAEVKRGLDLMSYIGRWLIGEPALMGGDGDLALVLPPLAQELSGFQVELELPEATPLRVLGASAVAEVLRIFLANSKHHVRHEGALLRARVEGEQIIVECVDRGPAMPAELRDAASTLAGQGTIKARPSGRYSRFAGLLAAHAIAESVGARVEYGGEDGAAIFRVIAQRA
ncbi:MAG: sensor histidine kinase [Deltaproteobacteria bacterium]|nr:sensor histidine kinase [Deltaproteobacteria bacterium]